MSLPAAGGDALAAGGVAEGTSVLAPPAPGRLGLALEATAAASYLTGLERWVQARRAELDALDAAALTSPQGSAATGDLLLSMALWKAVSDRVGLLRVTWNGGRVGELERERLSTLVWGRLDTQVSAPGSPAGVADGAAGLAVSLPEACRLSDSLVAALRVRLGLDLSAAEVTTRLRALRAQLERIRDQVGVEPAGPRQQTAAGTAARLARRLTELTDKAGRGGDVDGLFGPLEIEAATFERDLIVDAARRREAAGRLSRPVSCARSSRPGRRPCTSSSPGAWPRSTPRRATQSPTCRRSDPCPTRRASSAGTWTGSSRCPGPCRSCRRRTGRR